MTIGRTVDVATVRSAPWRPTPALVRSVVVGGMGALLGLLLQRIDLVVLASPFVLVTVWSVLARPTTDARVAVGTQHDVLVEGKATVTEAVAACPGMDSLALRVDHSPFVTTAPRTGAVEVMVPTGGSGSSTLPGSTDPATTATVGLRCDRWGLRTAGPAVVGGSSAWGAFRFGPVDMAHRLITTLPRPAAFDLTSERPHPQGLVGLNRSRHPGDGSEFATLRPFQAGDRLRRIHWARSARTQSLYVRSTYAEQDSHVLLLVDADRDLGTSGGVGGAESSLDVAVRAAAGIARVLLGDGDRVSLRVLGSAQGVPVPPGAGRRHLQRVLGALGQVSAGSDRRDVSTLRMPPQPPGTVVVLLSTLVSRAPLAYVARLLRRGHQVVVVDVLTTSSPADEADPLAWRLRMLEREQEVAAVTTLGAAVVPWRGAGSLDPVMRSLARTRPVA